MQSSLITVTTGNMSEPTKPMPAWQMNKLIQHIDGNIGSRIALADLCAVLHYSRAHFSRAFRFTFGCSVPAYLAKRRVELAAQYMLATDDKLSDIALRCGFSDQSHLARHFEKIKGESPGVWRRMHRRRAVNQSGNSDAT